MFNKDIRKTLRKIRKILESYQKKHPDLYLDNLCGLCHIGTTLTFRALRDKLPIKIAFRPGHSFNLINDNIILDVTATQFGFKPKITVKKLNKLATKWQYSWYSSYDNEQQLYNKFAEYSGSDPNQHPKKHEELINLLDTSI